jgi:hypothetical protein
MGEWSAQRVEQMAPDGAAVKAAQSVARPAKWRTLGCTDRLAWGECQGSGKDPYQVRVDLIDVTYKCSCPSRKLPCKHTLGLLLLFADGKSVPPGTPPAFVEEWSANRAKRAEAKQKKESDPDAAAPDLEAKAKRVEKRENRIGAGLEQLEAWLTDIVAQGLAAARAQPPAFWTQMSARLVDAQAAGLANRVSELADRALVSSRWQPQMLRGLGELQLLIDAYRNLDALPADLAAEVRQMIGWSQPQDELRERAGVRDVWQVIGRRQSQDQRLRVQYTWLRGSRGGRLALVLEFAAGPAPLPVSYTLGQMVDAEMVYFDGCPPLRALEKLRHGVEPRRLAFGDAADIAGMQAAYAVALATNPWLGKTPVVLGPVHPVIDAGKLFLQDATQRRVAVAESFAQPWSALALAGADVLTVFGEWDGFDFEPLTLECRGAWYTPAQIAALPVLSKVA